MNSNGSKPHPKRKSGVTRGAEIRQQLGLDPAGENRLDRLMEMAGMPKSLNSFPRRLERLDIALAADKTQNLPPDQRLQYMRVLAAPPIFECQVEKVAELLKASVSQARKGAGAKGLKAQGKKFFSK
jgi:hypothetical protein